MIVRATPDAYVGLDDATPAQWDEWHRAMLEERAAVRARAGLDGALYDDEATAWEDELVERLLVARSRPHQEG